MPVHCVDLVSKGIGLQARRNRGGGPRIYTATSASSSRQVALAQMSLEAHAVWRCRPASLRLRHSAQRQTHPYRAVREVHTPKGNRSALCSPAAGSEGFVRSCQVRGFGASGRFLCRLSSSRPLSSAPVVVKGAGNLTTRLTGSRLARRRETRRSNDPVESRMARGVPWPEQAERYIGSLTEARHIRKPAIVAPTVSNIQTTQPGSTSQPAMDYGLY